MGKSDKKLRILVMESDTTFLEQLKAFFTDIAKEQQHIEASYCSDEMDAKQYMQENMYDILLIDDDLPSLNAVEFLLFIHGEDNQCKNAKTVIRKTGNRVITKEQVDAFTFVDVIIDKELSSLELALAQLLENLSNEKKT